jgi:uncharacterized delta-60 repeat protein
MNSQTNEIPNPGTFDPDFGIGRPIEMEPPDSSLEFQPHGVAVDEAKNIYVVGLLSHHPFLSEYCCVKLTAKGHIDRNFGKQGYVTGQFSFDAEEAHSHAHEVKVLRDGKILIIGTYRNPSSGIESKALLRLHSSGLLDEEFGNKGKVILDLGNQSFLGEPEPKDQGTTSSGQPASNSTSITPDGKILLVDMFQREMEVFETRLIRLMSDGQLDTSFNEKGFVRIAHPEFPKTTRLDNLLVMDSGKYVLAGPAGPSLASPIVITQLHDTGKLDTSFASNGFLLIESTSPKEFRIMSLVKQTNQRLLVMGSAGYLDPDGLLISRERDGKENIQFNGGKPVLKSLDGLACVFSTASIQSNGTILVLGSVKYRDKPFLSTALARFTAAGELDLTYGNGTGWYSFDLISQSRTSAVFMPGKVLFLGLDVIDGEEYHYLARALVE